MSWVADEWVASAAEDEWGWQTDVCGAWRAGWQAVGESEAQGETTVTQRKPRGTKLRTKVGE